MLVGMFKSIALKAIKSPTARNLAWKAAQNPKVREFAVKAVKSAVQGMQKKR